MKKLFSAILLLSVALSTEAALTPGLYKLVQAIYTRTPSNTWVLSQKTVLTTNITQQQCAGYIAPYWPTSTTYAGDLKIDLKCVKQ